MTTQPHYREDLVFFMQHPEYRYRVRQAQPIEVQVFEGAHGPCPADKVIYAIIFRATYNTFFGCCFTATGAPADVVSNKIGRAIYERLRDELVEAQRRVTP